MRRLLSISLGLALLLAVVPAAQAQVGGIIKKKAPSVPSVPGTAAPTTTAAAKPKCEANSAVISSDLVNRYFKSLAARDAEIKKMAKEPGPTGAYYSAVVKRQAIKDRLAVYDQQKGPDWEKYLDLQKRLMAGDTSAISGQVALGQSLDPNQVQIPQLDWDNQQKSDGRINHAMQAAGGFSDCDWLDLGERLPRLVGILAQNPNTKEFQGYGTASEAGVVRANLSQLAVGLGISYESPEEKARKKKEADSTAKAVAELPSTGNAQLDCIQKYQMEWTKAHQAEMEAVQKSQDVNAMSRMSMQMQQEALAKCPAE